MWSRAFLLLASALLATAVELRRAEACGCFAPPDAASPIVQAGERILFARENGVVTAHIQIQYSGEARDFGWLLPLPSVPELSVGVDELFVRLAAATQPTYTLISQLDDCGGGGGESGGCIGFAGDSQGGDESGPLPRSPDAGVSPLVSEGSIGPYDYAILKADTKDEMLGWLEANRYFVPGIDGTVNHYIYEGAYFLALKLKSGKSTGDLQPIVLKYASDLPMIPIILTSVGAVPDMGIQVWMLGKARAIPRNYAHTVINDAQLDWLNAVRNYNGVVIRATREAAGRHTFITEYAGTSQVLIPDPPGRFGEKAVLARSPTIDDFADYLLGGGFVAVGLRTLSPSLLAILAARAPLPAGIVSLGIKPEGFFQNVRYYRNTYPQAMAGWPAVYEPEEMADEIWERIVQPTRDAAELFRKHPYLTRLYTTLSPADMTRDPVFSENPHLPGVSRAHQATITYHCNGEPFSRSSTPATLVTEQGFEIPYPNGTSQAPQVTTPASQRIETLAEEGNPHPVIDNSATIRAALARLGSASPGGGDGCRIGRRGAHSGIAIFGLLVLSRLLRRRRPGEH